MDRAEKQKTPIAQVSRERKTGPMSWPSPEAMRKRNTICVLMSDTLQVSTARVRIMVVTNINLFFWYSLLSPANSRAFWMES